METHLLLGGWESQGGRASGKELTQDSGDKEKKDSGGEETWSLAGIPALGTLSLPEPTSQP